MNKPKQKFRAGQITATVWENTKVIDGVETKVLSMTIEKSYKDKEGNWKTTNSFTTNDLPKVALVANKAFEFSVLSEQEETPSDSPVFASEPYPKITDAKSKTILEKIRELVEIGVPPDTAAKIAYDELQK